MHGGRTNQRHGTGVVDRLLEKRGGSVEIALLELDVAREQGGLRESETANLAGIDLRLEFGEGGILVVRVEEGHSLAEEFGLFGGGGLLAIPVLDNTGHDREDNHQGHEDLGTVLDKKFLDFRIALVRFVSHFRLPF